MMESHIQLFQGTWLCHSVDVLRDSTEGMVLTPLGVTPRNSRHILLCALCQLKASEGGQDMGCKQLEPEDLRTIFGVRRCLSSLTCGRTRQEGDILPSSCLLAGFSG